MDGLWIHSLIYTFIRYVCIMYLLCRLHYAGEFMSQHKLQQFPNIINFQQLCEALFLNDDWTAFPTM